MEQYAKILSAVKPRFIHHPECRKIIPALLESRGCDPDFTDFDVPRLRSSTARDYLTTGIAYAFHSHRDTWYSAPLCQINWWMPIYDIADNNGLAFHPDYWRQAVRNSSAILNYQSWHSSNRFNAVQHLKHEDRPHPKPLEAVEWEPSIVVIAPPGGPLLFSASHLRSAVFASRVLRGNVDDIRYGLRLRHVDRVAGLHLMDVGADARGHLVQHPEVEGPVIGRDDSPAWLGPPGGVLEQVQRRSREPVSGLSFPHSLRSSLRCRRFNPASKGNAAVHLGCASNSALRNGFPPREGLCHPTGRPLAGTEM